MTQTYSLTAPELFTFVDNGTRCQGANQEWYTDEWQRKSGCGPTCAAMLVSYLAHTRTDLRPLCPEVIFTKDDALHMMEAMWKHVTPGRMGVNSLYLFTKGLRSYATQQGLTLPLRELDIPALRPARPTVDQCAAFLRTAMNANSPVAFLNLSAGKVEGLDNWHWVTIVSFEEHSEGPLLCTALDGAKEITLDFRLWFQTSRAGGGLVYVPAL